MASETSDARTSSSEFVTSGQNTQSFMDTGVHNTSALASNEVERSDGSVNTPHSVLEREQQLTAPSKRHFYLCTIEFRTFVLDFMLLYF